MTESKLMMHECRFVEAPIISVVAEQRIRADGLGPIIEWLESRDPRCLPKHRNYETHPTRISLLLPGRRWDPGSGSEPPDISTSDNELLAELAGRLCYRSFGEAAGRKTNADYMQHIFSMDPLHACYDEKTEVLTSGGWKSWSDVTMGDALATRSPEGVLEYQLPTALTGPLPYRGRMYRVQSGMVDLLVTPNHRMLACVTTDLAGRERTNYQLISAEELGGRTHAYVKDATWLGGRRSTKLDRDVMALLGFAIGDGCLAKHTRKLVFHLRRPRKILWLHDLVSRLGWQITQHAVDRWHVALPEEHLPLFRGMYYWGRDRNGDPAKLKQIPEGALLAWDRPALEALLSGLIQSDGHISRTATSFDSASRRLAAQFQQLCLHVGWAAHVNYTTDDGNPRHEPLTRCTVIRRGLRPEVNRALTAKSCWVENWSGTVYCAQVPNGTLYVRRNGKPVWSGNSILYHAKMTFFFAGVSRKFSHQFIRNYVGSDRTEEGSPCLAADTRIYGYRASDTQTHSWTIKELHDRQLTARGRDTLRRIRLRSATPDGVLVPGKIKRVISSGKKPVFEVITRSGRKIRATACHRFLTAEGWRRLRELSVGSRLMANGLPGWANREWIEQKYVHEAMTRPEVARLLGMSDSALGKVIRAMGIKKPLSLRRNRRGGAGKKGMHSAEGLKRIALSKMGERNPSWKGAGVSRKGACLRAKRVMPAVGPCWGCQTTRKVERHHLDENFLNNSPDNLISLCAKCHKAFHFEGSITVFSDEIVAITELPAEETFDIEMEEEPHNFVANGLVVHNSQESTRFCEHSGFYVIPPYALAAGGQTLENFKSASKTNWIVYQALLQQEWSAFEKQHGREPKGLEKKRILEACSSTLSQDSETSFIWTTNPMALRKFIHERGSAAADQEIARFTRKLLTICKWKWPHFFTDMEIPNGTE